jgi:hypothetical protein
MAVQQTRKTSDARCPLCGDPVIYEGFRAGLLRFHVRPDGELVFLCAEPPRRVK